jgi:urea transporter
MERWRVTMLDWTLITIYAIAVAVAVVVFGAFGDALRAVNALLATLGAIITGWLIVNEIRDRLEAYYQKRFAPKKDKA